MHWQNLVTGLIVAGCTAYAAWRLMPASLRGRLALLLGRPAPAAAACGGCDGCGSGAAKSAAAAGPAVIKIVRQPPGSARR
jgi:hypothetical protein